MTLPTDEMDRLKQEFLAEAEDSLSWIQTALDEIHDDAAGASANTIEMIRRDVHSLKGMGAGFEFPTVTLIAHRLEDYLDSIETLKTAEARNVEVFLDHIQEILSAGIDNGLDAAEDLLHALPGGNNADAAPQQVIVGDILVVAQSRVMAKAIERELAPRGYRVTVAASPWRAFELAILMRPEALITSAIMDRMSGVELICALSQVSATAGIPKLIVSSLEPGHPELKRLPVGVDCLSPGQIASGGLAEAVNSRLAAGTESRAVRPTDYRPLRILIADDKKAIRLLVQVILQKEGHDLHMAENGAEAVAAVKDGRFDLVLMDIEMPQMNGVDATTAIRALDGPAASVPIIAMTANEHLDDRRAYERAGMSDYVQKPVEGAQLLEAIRRQTGVSPFRSVQNGTASSDSSPAPESAPKAQKEAALEELMGFLDE